MSVILPKIQESIFIKADKGRINQVISNLLSNAIKFTKVGSVTVAAVPNDNEIVVTITDTGPGIDSQILPRLFTKFATKSAAGTGFGLFISQSIIEAHGGKIWGKIIILKVMELRLDLTIAKSEFWSIAASLRILEGYKK